MRGQDQKRSRYSSASLALLALAHVACAGALGSADGAGHGKPAALTGATAPTTARLGANAAVSRSPPSDDGSTDGFEGEIDLDVQSMKYFFQLKGHRLRVLPDPGGAATQDESVVDCVSHREYVFFPGKQYTGGPLEGSGTSCPAEPADGSSGPAPAQVMKALGKTDTVAGYTCDLYKATRAGASGYQEICVSSELAALFKDLPPRIASYFVDFWGPKGFELRTRSYDERGALVWTNVVARLEKRRIPIEAFQVPSGYRELKR